MKSVDISGITIIVDGMNLLEELLQFVHAFLHVLDVAIDGSSIGMKKDEKGD